MSNTKKVAKSAAMIAVFTLFSKFLGFIREMLIAYKFGSGYETDTYFVAMTATVLIMSTVGAALNTTLIPIFSEIEEKRGKKYKLKYLNNILNVVLIITIVLGILGYFLSPVVIKVLAKGFTGKQFDLAVKLNRIGLPIMVFLGFTYVFSGFLQSSEKFGPPAIAGIPFNLVYIVYLLVFSNRLGVVGLMVASVIASSAQFLIQVPATKRLGYSHSFQVDLKDRYINKAILLVLPVLLGSAVQQINTVVDKTLASSLVEGSISALNYSTKINSLVISVFVTAITTVVFPMLAKAFNQNDTNQVKEIMGEGINIILIITVPATIGIVLIAKPIVKIFFERGAFDETATLMTSQALTFYSLGLVGSSLRLMLNKVYYSYQDTVTPMVNGILAVIINLIFNLILVKPMAHSGLALATSISSTITTLLLFINLRKKMKGPIGLKRYISCFIKTLISALIMGLIVNKVYFGLTSLLPDKNIIQLLVLIFTIGLGGFIYIILCSILRVKEIRVLLNRIVRIRRK